MLSSSSTGWNQPATGGARDSQPASGGAPASGGSYAVMADGVTRRWAATQCEPWESGYHKFHYTKAVQGARIDMMVGEWNKQLLEEELENHPLIISFVGNSRKLINSSPDAHECDTNYRCV